MGGDGEFILSLTLFKMIEAMRIKEIDAMIKSLENELQGVKSTPTTPQKQTPQTPNPTPIINQGELLYAKLIEKIYDRNYGLGEIFEKNITYASFEHNTLTWDSVAKDEDKKILISQWGLIKTFVQDIFGIDTTIKSNTKNTPLSKETPTHEPQTSIEEESGSMIEEIEMKNSCLSPEHTSANEIEPSQILEEPMIRETIKLFEPSKVRVRRKV